MNPCVNAFLTAYLAAPLWGVGFAVFARLRGVYVRSGGGSRGGGLGLGVCRPSMDRVLRLAGVQGSCVGVRKSLNTFDMQSMIDRVVFNMLKWLVSNSDLWCD